MKVLHTLTAAVETGTGVALLACPSGVVTLLLGAPLDSTSAFTLGRVAGAALLAFGVACWTVREHGLLVAILIYNFAVAGILACAGLISGLVGLALWPAVILHAVIAVWCVACLKQGFTNRI
jgi:hypothetical protein